MINVTLSFICVQKTASSYRCLAPPNSTQPHSLRPPFRHSHSLRYDPTPQVSHPATRSAATPLHVYAAHLPTSHLPCPPNEVRRSTPNACSSPQSPRTDPIPNTVHMHAREPAQRAWPNPRLRPISVQWAWSERRHWPIGLRSTDDFQAGTGEPVRRSEWKLEQSGNSYQQTIEFRNTDVLNIQVGAKLKSQQSPFLCYPKPVLKTC